MEHAFLRRTVKRADRRVQLGIAGGAALFKQRVACLDHLGADGGLHRPIADVLPFAGPDALARGSGVGHARSSRSLDNRGARPGSYEPGTHEASSISATVSRLSTWVVPAYAKLNLSLGVVARRPDGWHDIDSVLVPVDWHDLVGLSVEPAETDMLSLSVDGPAAAGVPTGDGNLTVRAAQALRELAGRPLAIRVWLSKTVPHGAGLGGGSADAAAVMRAGAARLAGLGVAIEPGHVAAAALGDRQ